MNNRILIVDDDEKLGRYLCEYLTGFGFKTERLTDSRKALESAARLNPSLIVLDVMMPEMDGFEFCKQIRTHSSVPILMLTARGEVGDRITGLEAGADDYLPKPFEPRELVARIKALLRRRRGGAAADCEQYGPLTVYYKTRRAELDGKDIGLTNAEFELLALFTHHPGRVLNRERIINALRGIEWQAIDRSVDITISRLRQKLGDNSKQPRFFKTVWGRGYLFIGHELTNEDN